MPINLELKAKVSSLSKTKKIVGNIAEFAEAIRQTDTYFNVRSGRLKLREISRRSAELIYYRRNEQKGPRWSNYEITKISSPSGLKRSLGRALGIKAVVCKNRSVYIYKKIARIHLDSVRGLGEFLELEVISKHDPMKAKRIHDELVDLLRISGKQRISSSYSDLIIAKRAPGGNSR